MTKTEKLYPFSMRKHAHDLEFRRNRLSNIFMSDPDKFPNALETERETLGNILTMRPNCDSIVFLNGREYYIAINAIGWAESNRK